MFFSKLSLTEAEAELSSPAEVTSAKEIISVNSSTWV